MEVFHKQCEERMQLTPSPPRGITQELLRRLRIRLDCIKVAGEAAHEARRRYRVCVDANLWVEETRQVLKMNAARPKIGVSKNISWWKMYAESRAVSEAMLRVVRCRRPCWVAGECLNLFKKWFSFFRSFPFFFRKKYFYFIFINKVILLEY